MQRFPQTTKLAAGGLLRLMECVHIINLDDLFALQKNVNFKTLNLCILVKYCNFHFNFLKEPNLFMTRIE